MGFDFFILIWSMSWYMILHYFILVYDLVYDSQMLGIQKDKKLTLVKYVWSDIPCSNICMVYEKY